MSVTSSYFNNLKPVQGKAKARGRTEMRAEEIIGALSFDTSFFDKRKSSEKSNDLKPTNTKVTSIKDY